MMPIRKLYFTPKNKRNNQFYRGYRYNHKFNIRDYYNCATRPENIPKTPNAILKLTSQETPTKLFYLSPIIKDEFDSNESNHFLMKSRVIIPNSQNQIITPAQIVLLTLF
jgi:hypothetical protein